MAFFGELFAGISHIVDVLFGPFLSIPPLLAIILLSLLLSLLSTLAMKYFTKQDEMKSLKSEMKSLQEEAKRLKAHPEQALAVQQRVMEANLKYMSHSMRGTLFTIIPIILLFNWMGAHFGYEPLLPNQPFGVTLSLDPAYEGLVEIVEILPEQMTLEDPMTGEVSLGPGIPAAHGVAKAAFSGPAGDYVVTFRAGNETLDRPIHIGDDRKFSPPVVEGKGPVMNSATLDYQKLVLIPIGYRNWFGWFGTYFFSMILFSLLFKKWFNVA